MVTLCQVSWNHHRSQAKLWKTHFQHNQKSNPYLWLSVYSVLNRKSPLPLLTRIRLLLMYVTPILTYVDAASGLFVSTLDGRLQESVQIVGLRNNLWHVFLLKKKTIPWNSTEHYLLKIISRHRAEQCSTKISHQNSFTYAKSVKEPHINTSKSLT